MGIQLGMTDHPRGLASTQWTSTSARPFGPAPGAGVAGLESGFAAQEVKPFAFDDERIRVDQAFSVKKQPVAANEIPSMVIRFLFTDRGSITKGAMDKQVSALLKKAGYRVSIKSSFKPVTVRWKWGTIGKEAAGDTLLYVPVVAEPAAYAGLRYASSSHDEPLYAPDDKKLSQVPTQIWVYTMAVTSASSSMTDGEAAQVLTLLKLARVNIAKSGANAFSSVWLTMRGCPSTLFGGGKRPKKGGWSPILLVAAFEILRIHAGSEVL